jgi:hypothetical protein
VLIALDLDFLLVAVQSDAHGYLTHHPGLPELRPHHQVRERCHPVYQLIKLIGVAFTLLQLLLQERDHLDVLAEVHLASIR